MTIVLAVLRICLFVVMLNVPDSWYCLPYHHTMYHVCDLAKSLLSREDVGSLYTLPLKVLFGLFGLSFAMHEGLSTESMEADLIATAIMLLLKLGKVDSVP